MERNPGQHPPDILDLEREEKPAGPPLNEIISKIAGVVYRKTITVEDKKMKEEALRNLVVQYPDFFSFLTPDQPNTNEKCEIIENYLINRLEAINPPNVFSVEGEGFQGKEGYVIADQEANYLVQIDDPEDGLRQGDAALRQFYETFVESLSLHRHNTSLFKAHVVVRDGVVVVSIDPGKHKEWLAYVAPVAGGSDFVAYRHHKSINEKNKKNNLRAEFIKRILNGRKARLSTDENEKSITAVGETKGYTLATVLQLCRAVKDLDLLLKPEDLNFAIKMFNEGVTNLDHFLALARTLRHEPLNKKARGSTKQYLNDHESELLQKYEKYLDKKTEEKERSQRKVEAIHRGKELNYEILDLLLQYENQARAIVQNAVILPGRRSNLHTLANSIIDKINAMRSCAAHTYRTFSLTQTIYLPFATALLENARSLDESVNRRREVSPEARAYLNTTLYDMSNQADIAVDQAISPHDAVRILHAQLYLSNETIGTGGNMQWDTSPFCDSNDPVTSFPMIDVSKDNYANSPIYKVFVDAVNRLSLNTRRGLSENISEFKSPHIIIGDDYLDLTIPQNKHKMELVAQSKTTPPAEYGVSLRYFESGYRGSEARLKFVHEILVKKLQFKIVKMDTVDRGLLVAKFVSENEADWKRAFTTAVQLLHALQDLDLSYIAPDAAELFTNGVYDIKHAARQISALREPDTAERELNFAIIFLFRADRAPTERQYAARTLWQKFGTFKAFKPYLNELNETELDLMISAFFSVQDQEKKAKNPKGVAALGRILDRLMDYYDNKFPSQFPTPQKR